MLDKVIPHWRDHVSPRDGVTLVKRSKLCLAHLLVYLTALVGGTLHHHAHELSSADASNHFEESCWSQAASSSSDGDEDACTICGFLHQAQERPASVTLVADVLVEPALNCTLVGTPSALLSSFHARAPPVA